MTALETIKPSLEEVFGKMPAPPLHLSVRPISVNCEFLDGSASLKEMEMELEFESGIARLPFTLVIPKSNLPRPAVVLISKEEGFKERAIEWVIKGYAVFSIYFKDISENNGNFKSGISTYIAPTRRKKSSAGKVAIWAWAATRALEYAEVLDEISKDKIGVVGDGILALSAVMAEGECERFSFASATSMPELTAKFVRSNPHLFSPSYSNNTCFDY